MKSLFTLLFSLAFFHGCFGQKTDSTLKDTCTIYAPNTLSPNDDGINDRWCFTSNCPLKDFELSIFDRWGNKIWSSKDIKECWDPATKAGGKKVPVQSGVYLWKLTYLDWADKKCSRVGQVSVVN